MCSASLIKVSLIIALYFLNGAQFLNAAFVLASPPTTAMFPATKTYASEKITKT